MVDQIQSFLKKTIVVDGEEDAFVVIDLADVRRKLDAWKTCLPRVEPFYAVKCNDHVEILREMAHQGLNFDCASMGEIRKVLDLGVSPDKIIYANPCKQVSHLSSAEKVGVRFMTFDNSDELKKIKTHCPHAVVVLRLATDDSKAVCRLSQKFGAQLDKVPFLLKKVKEFGLDFGGFSYHVGSGCEDEDSFVEAVHNARKAFDTAESLGFHPKLLDIGGGFSGAVIHQCDIERAENLKNSEVEDPNKRIKQDIANHPTEQMPDGNSDSDIEPSDLYQKKEKLPFPEVARMISQALELYFPEELGYRIIAEPGRYFVHSCGTLAASIIARRTPQRSKSFVAEDEVEGKEPEPDRIMYYINEGVYGAFSNTIYDHAHVIPNILKLDDTEKEGKGVFDSSIWGPSCDGLDCVVKSVDLPKLKVGSWLFFENMGAYTICAGSNFNGFKRPNVYAINGSAPEVAVAGK